MRLACCALWLSAGLYAQQFEVASLKPSPPLQRPYPARVITGGPGTTSAGQITYREHSLRDLIFQAYRLQLFQLTTPAWMETTYLDIVATVPAGATRDDLRPMLQHLLADRFGLRVHTEKRAMSGYALALGDAGHKLTVTPPVPAATDSRLPAKLDVDKDGFVIAPAGVPNIFYLPPKDGIAHLTAARATMAMFCSYLARLLQQPVADETGLEGSYDFRLKFAPENAASTEAADDGGIPRASDPAPTLTRAVASQLGLKLTRKRVPVDVVVIDHCERVPTEN